MCSLHSTPKIGDFVVGHHECPCGFQSHFSCFCCRQYLAFVWIQCSLNHTNGYLRHWNDQVAAAVASHSKSDYDYDDKDEGFDVFVVISDIGSDNDDDNLGAQPSDSCIERKIYCSLTTLSIKTGSFNGCICFLKTALQERWGYICPDIAKEFAKYESEPAKWFKKYESVNAVTKKVY